MRLLAYLGNDPERLACALHPLRGLLRGPIATEAEPEGSVDAFGVGFVQGAEVLLRRRPRPPQAPVDLFELAREIRSDALIAQLRTGQLGPAGSDNTPPFRFRAWLGTFHGGPLAAPARARLVESLPELMRRNLRGETAAEAIVHGYLGRLLGAGRLDERELLAAEAVHQAVSWLDELDQIAGAPVDGSLAVTNGRILIVSRGERPLFLHRLDGIRDCAVCRERAGLGGPGHAQSRAVPHDHLRAIVLVADGHGPLPRGGEAVPPRSVVAVSQGLQVEVRPRPGAGANSRESV